MVKTIGNPLTWVVQGAGAAGGHAVRVAEDIGGTDHAQPRVQRLFTEDIREALAAGIADFAALRSDVIVLCLLYPVIGLVLAYFALNAEFVQLVFPLIAGFALLGPVAGVGLYEMSRRRERGETAAWASAFKVLENPAIGSIAALAAYMAALFVAWMLVAAQLYALTLGPTPPASASGFLEAVLTTAPGWTMAILGTAIGFVFAVAALCLGLVSFPMMLDRHVGVPQAVATSVEVVRKNPRIAAMWGLVVTGLLIAGSVPMLLGLVIVLPVLGHATWHLYRRAVRWT